MLSGSRTSTPFVYACILCIGSALIALYHYAALAALVPPPIVPKFSGAAKTGYLKTDQGCFGEIHGEVVESGDNAAAEVTGNMMLSVLGKLVPVELTGSLYFNSLGQLTASVIRILSDDTTIALGTTNISPIKFTFKLEQGKNSTIHSFPLPGPLVLKRLKEQMYAIEYPHFKAIQLPLADKLLQSTENLPMNITLEETPCATEEQTALNADSIIAEALKHILPLAQKLNEGGIL